MFIFYYLWQNINFANHTMIQKKKMLNNKLLRVVPILLGILIMSSSCDLFFRKELRQDRKLAYYRHRVYVINDSLKNNSERIKAYKELVAQASEDEYLITPRKKNMLLSEIYTNISAEYYDTFRPDEAIESCNLAIMLNVNNKSAYFNRAYLYELTNKDSLALENYTKAIELDDNYADAYYNRGMLYENMTDYQLAIEDYSRAIRLNPPYLADVYNNRGNTYQEMNFFDKAISDYTKAVSLNPANSVALFNRGNAYLNMGMKNEALLDFNRILELEPSNLFVIEKIKTLEEEFTNDSLQVAKGKNADS